jgi:hypothetical protein
MWWMRLDFEHEQELSEELLLLEEEEEEAGDGTWMHLHSTEVEPDDEEPDDDEDDELSMDSESQCAFSPQRCCTLTLCQPSAFCSPLVCTTSASLDDELEDDPDQECCESLELDDEELSSLDDDELQLLLLDEGRQEQSSSACATATHRATQRTRANFILMAAKIIRKVC